METDDVVLRFFPAHLRPGFVLLGGLFAMLSFGSVYTFGNMLPYMVSYMRWKFDPHMSSGSLIWLQTLMSGVPFAMLAGGVLERKFGGRKTAIIGSLLYTGSTALTFYSIQYSYAMVLLTMGLIGSIGNSIAYNGILTTAQRWLPDSVGLAGGLIVAGYGCGAFILSPLQTAYINPLDYPVDKHGFFTQTDLLERVPYVFLVQAIVFAMLECVGLFFVGAPKEEIRLETDQLILDPRESSLSVQLKSHTFLLLFCSLTLNALWVQLVSGLYKAYGQQFVKSDLFLSLIGSMASICNASSRISWGYIVDKQGYQICMSLVCCLGAALAWLLPAVAYYANHVVYLITICTMFTCVGGTYSLFPYITHKCFGNGNFSVVYGVLQCSLSVAGVAAGLLSQFVLPKIGFEMLFLLCGFFMFTSFVLTAVLHCTDFAPNEDLQYSQLGNESEAEDDD